MRGQQVAQWSVEQAEFASANNSAIIGRKVSFLMRNTVFFDVCRPNEMITGFG